MTTDMQYSALLTQLLNPDLDPATRDELTAQLHDRYLQLREAGTFGSTTPAGLPYPSPTDPVAAGADAIRALAEAVITTQYREFVVNRAAVPAGTALFFLTVAAKPAPISDPTFPWTYTAGDGAFVLTDPGFYLITASLLIDWANAGALATFQIRDTAATSPLANAPFGGLQTTTLSTLYYSDGVKKLVLEAVHNSGGTRNLDGVMRIARIGKL